MKSAPARLAAHAEQSADVFLLLATLKIKLYLDDLGVMLLLFKKKKKKKKKGEKKRRNTLRSDSSGVPLRILLNLQ